MAQRTSSSSDPVYLLSRGVEPISPKYPHRIALHHIIKNYNGHTKTSYCTKAFIIHTQNQAKQTLSQTPYAHETKTTTLEANTNPKHTPPLFVPQSNCLIVDDTFENPYLSVRDLILLCLYQDVVGIYLLLHVSKRVLSPLTRQSHPLLSINLIPPDLLSFQGLDLVLLPLLPRTNPHQMGFNKSPQIPSSTIFPTESRIQLCHQLLSTRKFLIIRRLPRLPWKSSDRRVGWRKNCCVFLRILESLRRTFHRASEAGKDVDCSIYGKHVRKQNWSFFLMLGHVVEEWFLEIVDRGLMRRGCFECTVRSGFGESG